MKEYLVPTFDREDITAKVVMSENMSCNESFAVDSLNDPVAVKRTDIVGTHNYGSSYIPFPTTKAKGKGIWQTEVSDLNGNDLTIRDGLKWAKEVHDFMTITQGNSWSYWWGACFKTWNGEALIQMDMNSKTYKVGKRLYTIGQYSRFVRPGWQRFSATSSPASNVYVTAYKDPDTGEFAIVAVNNGQNSQSLSFTMDGFSASSVTPYTTSERKNLDKGSDISVSGTDFSFSLAANSVTTFVGTNAEALPAIKYGDVNGDGEANSTDYALVKRYILGTVTDFGYKNGEKAADVNADGEINSTDYAFIKKYILGTITKFPAEQ